MSPPPLFIILKTLHYRPLTIGQLQEVVHNKNDQQPPEEPPQVTEVDVLLREATGIGVCNWRMFASHSIGIN